LGHMARGLTTNNAMPQEGSTWWLQLPEPYQKMYQEQVSEEFFAALNDPKNMARAMASEMSFGLSDIPVGLYHGGSAAIDALAKGEPGQAAEAITPAAASIALMVITHKMAKGKGGGVAVAESEAESKAFTLPEYKGPLSPAAARVRALLALKNPALADMSAQIVDRLGVEGVEKAASYIQGNSAAARFVMNNGVAGLEALVAAEGDVAAARLALGSQVPTVPKALPPGPQVKGLLPPWNGPPVRNPPPGMSPGEMAEESALRPMRPTAKLLPEKAGAYDATVGGQKILESEVNTTDKAGNPIKVRVITIRQPDDAIQIKTLTGVDKTGQPATPAAMLERVKQNVKVAIAKAYSQPPTLQRGRTPIPGTSIYERTTVEAPKKITIIVQVPGEVTDEMRAIAQKTVDQSTAAQALVPPIEVIVQQEQ